MQKVMWSPKKLPIPVLKRNKTNFKINCASMRRHVSVVNAQEYNVLLNKIVFSVFFLFSTSHFRGSSRI